MQPSGASEEFDVARLTVGRMSAVPQTSPAVYALFTLKRGRAVCTLCDGLTGTHCDTGFLSARPAQILVEKPHMVRKSGHGLDLAAHQECILLRDQQAAVEGNLRPAARCKQCIVEGTALVGRFSDRGFSQLLVCCTLCFKRANLLRRGRYLRLQRKTAVGQPGQRHPNHAANRSEEHTSEL